MTRSNRHAARLAMRTFFTATAFLTGLLYAGISHDGFAPAGGILAAHQPYLIGAAICWAVAVVLDGITSEPGKGRI